METPPSEQNPRRGRARERMQRRKAQQEQTPSAPNLPRQIRPIPRYELPEIKLPVNRGLLAFAGSILLVVLVIIVLGLVRNQPPQSHPNAMWVGIEWTYETHDDETIMNYAQQLRDNQIGTLYAWVSWLQADGTWRGQSEFDEVQAFVEQMRRFYPEIELHGWVGFPVEEGGYRMDDTAVQQSVAAFSQRVVDELGFDGIFLNAEPVWNGDDNFLALLRQVRSVVGQDVPISTAIPPDWSPLGAGIPVPAQIVPGTIWEKEYKQSVALLVDEMVVMAYLSGLTDAADYSRWMAYQVETFARAIAELNTGTEVVIGIPTFDAEPPGHDPLVENIPSAVEGIKVGLETAGDASRYVKGVAIYGGWTTDDDEWALFKRDWVDRE